jgi:hypothetical protein
MLANCIVATSAAPLERRTSLRLGYRYIVGISDRFRAAAQKFGMKDTVFNSLQFSGRISVIER